MKKRVLITGASGFVGYHLILEALKKGLEVYAAVRSDSIVDHLSDFDINYVHLNYDSIEDLTAQIDKYGFHYIIHGAGITKAKTQEIYNKINADFAKNLATAASLARIPLQKFVFLSSLAALGPLDDTSTRIQDDSVASPVTSYGRSKLLAEQYLAQIPNLPLIVIRPTAVYGPREKDLFVIFKTINSGIDPHIGSFRQQLSFIYVEDLAFILVKALEVPLLGRSYNVSDGFAYDRYALSAITKSVLNKRALRVNLPIKLVNYLAILMEKIYFKRKETPVLNKEKMNELTAINWACDIKRIQEDMGFIARYNLEQGLKETLLWYKENKWL